MENIHCPYSPSNSREKGHWSLYTVSLIPVPFTSFNVAWNHSSRWLQKCQQIQLLPLVLFHYHKRQLHSPCEQFLDKLDRWEHHDLSSSTRWPRWVPNVWPLSTWGHSEGHGQSRTPQNTDQSSAGTGTPVPQVLHLQQEMVAKYNKNTTTTTT